MGRQPRVETRVVEGGPVPRQSGPERRRLGDLGALFGEKSALQHHPSWNHPPPTRRAQRVLRAAARAILWVQVGAVTVRGREHLAGPGPKLIVANHGHYVDCASFVRLLDEPPRFMAARGVFRFAGGLLSGLATACGAFCVDLEPGKGAAAREVAVRLLVAGQTVVMFPEGWVYMDGGLGPLKNGAARAAHEAARRLGHPIAVVPVALRYGRYPGAWIRRLPFLLQFLVVLLGWLRYRRGVTVSIGAPISSAVLRGRECGGTALLRRELLALGARL